MSNDNLRAALPRSSSALQTRRPTGQGVSERSFPCLVLLSLCFTKDLVGFVIDTICTILCILRHIFKQLIQRLQLTPVITTVSRLRRGFAGVADLVLVHAVSVAAGGLLVIF